MGASEAVRLPSEVERLVLAGQAAAEDVRLVGGAGLALLLGHRRSEDVDLFAPRGTELEPVVRAVEIERVWTVAPDAVRPTVHAAVAARALHTLVDLAVAVVVRLVADLG